MELVDGRRSPTGSRAGRSRSTRRCRSPADRRSARSGARAGHHPSGSEARQHQGARGRHGEGAGLRAGEGARPGHGSAEVRSRSNSPTITSPAMTHAGVILGTAAYMSPEQARGEAVDKRADIWAFGCVLYEMLTGRRAFGGEKCLGDAGACHRGEPDWNALPARTPLPIRRLLRRCLEKDRKRRLDSAAAARFEVEEAMTAAGENENGAADSRAAWRRALPWALTGVSAVALAFVLLSGGLRRNVASTAPIRVHVGLGAEATLATVDRGSAAILSPNGQALVFVGQRRTGPASLFVRRLDQLDATPLPGTEGAHSPFFSPDGEWVAFFADAKLKKVALSGGAPVTLCDTPDAQRRHWGLQTGRSCSRRSFPARIVPACCASRRPAGRRRRSPHSPTAKSHTGGRRSCRAATRCSLRVTPAA